LTISKLDQIRMAAEADLEKFILLVHPKRVLGAVHRELISWWNREDAKSHQLVLLPRDHQKSAMVAYRVAWEITRNPSVRILYISSTSNLAVKQLKFIKDILTCAQYRRYWPEMIHPEEAKREKWTETEISVDHPKRKADLIRDPTVFTAGLTTTITGMHCDIAVLDDVVVFENAYTEEGRSKVLSQFSLLASIEGTGGREWLVGTRYHPKDLYSTLKAVEVELFTEDGEYDKENSYHLYEVFERQVESSGDGTGEFLWPKQQRSDGAVFGFDQKELARKKAQYVDKTQFRAQYYNDPNDVTNSLIPRECFQYYEPSYLGRAEGKWSFKGRRLNVFASVDFAFSLNSKSDFTAIVVVGVDQFGNYYVLDIDRFKTDKISEYFKHILQLHQKWDFRTLGAEVTVAQDIIVKDLKENYIRAHGLALSVKDFRPTRNEGSKEERMKAILQPRYENRSIYHYRGGNCQILEDELVLDHPPHDDVKDALAACIAICVQPTASNHSSARIKDFQSSLHTRFGGVA
jgi:phage terminase large subunit-like protein